MYYLLYGLLYLISLLPFFILYGISDFVFFLLYYVFGYRKQIVMNNLSIAFPEKSVAESKAIASKFYKNLTDTFIETIKMVSMSEKQFDKRCSIEWQPVLELEKDGRNIQFHMGHQMNWEYANWIVTKNLTILPISIYQGIGNRAINKIFVEMRGRFRAKMVSTSEFRKVMHVLIKSQYGLGLIADQNPAHANDGYWLYFFSRPVPFIKGPEKGAIKNNTAVIFINSKKLKRGYYHFETKLVTANAVNLPAGELTRKYRDFLEETIRQQPENYLWTHRRWRHEFNAGRNKWIDGRSAPLF